MKMKFLYVGRNFKKLVRKNLKLGTLAVLLMVLFPLVYRLHYLDVEPITTDPYNMSLDYSLSCNRTSILDVSKESKKLHLIKNYYLKVDLNSFINDNNYNFLLNYVYFFNNFKFKYCINSLNSNHGFRTYEMNELFGTLSFGGLFKREFLCIQDLVEYLNIFDMVAPDTDVNFREYHAATVRNINVGLLQLDRYQMAELTEYFERQAKSTTYIIVPVFNRDDNLEVLLSKLHVFLSKQFIYNYQLIVAEQSNVQERFNKGRLFNMAYKYLKDNYGVNLKHDCLIFHDVDLIPKNDYNLYECDQVGNSPRHLSLLIKKANWNVYKRYPYDALIGGVLTIKPFVFEILNGYSNEYWLWGGEDDGSFINLIFVVVALLSVKIL